MFRVQSRPAHYLLLAAAYFLMTLPNLGAHSFWDMDEGVNAEAGREMLESGNWITPHFNYQIRTAKPAMLCWMMAASYEVFGINEFAARLPSVLCGLGSVIVTYELGRRMFSASTGLLAAIALASSFEFCLISHAATPDPPLIFFTTCAFFIYWAGSEGDRRWWFVPFGALTGLATLTKGPVGIAMPGLVILLHLLWTRRLDKLWDSRLIHGAAMFLLVAGPWYGMVTLDTKGKWPAEFFMHDHLKRFSEPSEGHRGPFFFHAVGIMVLFVPWSLYLPPAIWYAVREARRQPAKETVIDEPGKYRFLLSWFLAYLVIFSISATKLPNYVLPLYPAMAVLTARLLDRWRLGEIDLPRWVTIVALITIGVVGLIIAAAMVVLSGAVMLPFTIKGFRPVEGFLPWAPIGIVPVIVAMVGWWLFRRGRIDELLTVFATGAVITLAFVSAGPAVTTQQWRAPKYLAEEVGLRQTDKDIRIVGCRWLRQSLVFYARREVTPMNNFQEINRFLAIPRPGYVIVTDEIWPYLEKELTVPTRIIARRFDFFSRRDVLVIANEYAAQE